MRRRPPTRNRASPDDTFIDLYVALVSRPDDRPQPAGRGRVRPAQKTAQAGTAGHRRRRGGRLLVQGLGLCPRRHLRPDRAPPGGPEHPFPRPQPHAAGRPGRCGRAGAARDRAVHDPARVHPRSDGALAAPAARAAGRRRARQGIPDLRCRLHAAGRSTSSANSAR